MCKNNLKNEAMFLFEDTRLYDNNNNIILEYIYTDLHVCDGDDYDNNIIFERSNAIVSTAVGMIIIYYNIKCIDYYSNIITTIVGNITKWQWTIFRW